LDRVDGYASGQRMTAFCMDQFISRLGWRVLDGRI
jgi:hypothetical protein